MGFHQQRGQNRIEWERQLERLCPILKVLVRANPYTCSTCYENGRLTQRLTCPNCNGTGYNGGVKGADLTQAPYSTRYYIHADIQNGHGMYGAGGSMIEILQDLGKMDHGDATIYTKIQEFDRVSGSVVAPQVSKTLPRPDLILDTDGTAYNLVRALRGDVGDELIFLQFLAVEGGYRS